jgi:pimeloyl-ACP methyl ester carboxylesterase
VVTGEFDGGCNPRLNEFMHRELPDSRLVILEGLKHSLMIEASDRVLPHLREFLLEQGAD